MKEINRSLVSIVICCYNRGHMLPQTMGAVFNQEYTPVEIIVVDDGSTDNTRELMFSYGEKIRYHWQQNQGVAVARTNGGQLANGEFIAYQDDDDIMPPDRITVLMQALHQYPSAVMAVGDFAIIDDNGKLTGKRWLPERTGKNHQPVLIENGYEAVLWPTVPATPHTTLFRKRDGDRIGWFDTRYRYASEDKDFFARLSKLGPIVYVPQVVSYYRRGHASLTRSHQRKPITAHLNKLDLLSEHLKSFNSGSEALKSRLQHRILLTLKKIALLKIKNVPVPTTESGDYLTQSLALLNFHDRLKYWWYVLAVLQIKKILRRI